MPVRINRRDFQEMVREALTGLPDEFAAAMKNVAVVGSRRSRARRTWSP